MPPVHVAYGLSRMNPPIRDDKSALGDEITPKAGSVPSPGGGACTPPDNSRDDAERERCILCGEAMYGVHCKRICPNCGYREDCSDLFPL